MRVEYVQGTSLFSVKSLPVKGAKSTDFFVKGFASIRGVDRHGEDLSPRAFDVTTFMRNPQLWLNHELFPTARGIMAPIGRVEQMNVARVEEISEGAARLVDVFTEETIEESVSMSDFLVKDGDEGVWVVARVMEPEVIAFVSDGRLNAFSWSGTIIRRPDGKLLKIDVREVSLVFLPANARALFVVGKDAMPRSSVYLVRDGVVFPMEKSAQLRDDKTGPGYLFLLRSAHGNTHVLEPSGALKSDDAARAVGEQYARDVYEVAVLKNQWKSTTDGYRAYALVHFVEGASGGALDTVLAAAKADYDETPWPTDYVDSLPDSAFAYVCETDGRRYFPFVDADGKVDADALKRSIRQALLSPFAAKAVPVLHTAATELGIADWLTGGEKSPLTQEEQRLLGVYGEPVDTTKGGDEDMTTQELLKQIQEGMTAITGRLDAIEKTRKEATDGQPADGDTASTATAPPAQPTVAPPQPAAQASEEEDDEAAEKALTDLLTTVLGSVNALSDRVKRLEDTPAQSQQADDASVESAKSVKAQIDERMKGMTPEQRKQVSLRAFSRQFERANKEMRALVGAAADEE